MKKNTRIIIFISILFVFSLQMTSCFASGVTTQTFIENKINFQKGNFQSLKLIKDEDLRDARDNKNATLYYGGLLLFFNDRKQSAEIAFRRAARTGKEPWAKESARLVVYFMTLDARYNQIAPFLESIYKVTEIRTDPELFYYYTFALFLSKNYEALSNVIDTTMPKWNNTLRNRITVGQASFYFDFWKVFLQVKDNVKNITPMLNVMTKYRASYMVGDIQTLIEKIYGKKFVPQIIQNVLNAKRALQNKDKEAAQLFLQLDANLFINDGMINDLIQVFSDNRRYVSEVYSIFNEVESKLNNKQKMHVGIARAYYLYEKQQYSKSYAAYKQALKNNVNIEKSTYLAAQWRMLFSIMQVNYDTFIKDFDVIVQNSEQPQYFSNLLEEYLSLLLRKNKYTRIQDDFMYLKDRYKTPHIQIELRRWSSILIRIAPEFSNELSLQENLFSNFVRDTEYYSDFPFDYLINYDSIQKEDFINVWKSYNVEKNTVSSLEDNNNLFELFVDGYFEYGLYNYARTLAEENIATMSDVAIRKTVNYFTAHSKGKEPTTDAFSILRKGAARSLVFPQDEADFYILYPNLFKTMVEGVTKDPRKRAVIFALIREESGFDAKIKSSANAIGLMQLLQATADDIASRIDYKNFSLIDPKDNITLGYNYFTYLVRVVENPISALAAYNGGLGNLWKWEKQFNTNDLVVFADSLPFRETRNYVRKVVSSAMIYALLYYDISPQEMKKYFTQKK